MSNMYPHNGPGNTSLTGEPATAPRPAEEQESVEAQSSFGFNSVNSHIRLTPQNETGQASVQGYQVPTTVKMASDFGVQAVSEAKPSKVNDSIVTATTKEISKKTSLPQESTEMLAAYLRAHASQKHPSSATLTGVSRSSPIATMAPPQTGSRHFVPQHFYGPGTYGLSDGRHVLGTHHGQMMYDQAAQGVDDINTPSLLQPVDAAPTTTSSIHLPTEGYYPDVYMTFDPQFNRHVSIAAAQNQSSVSNMNVRGYMSSLGPQTLTAFNEHVPQRLENDLAIGAGRAYRTPLGESTVYNQNQQAQHSEHGMQRRERPPRTFQPSHMKQGNHHKTTGSSACYTSSSDYADTEPLLDSYELPNDGKRTVSMFTPSSAVPGTSFINKAPHTGTTHPLDLHRWRKDTAGAGNSSGTTMKTTGSSVYPGDLASPFDTSPMTPCPTGKPTSGQSLASTSTAAYRAMSPKLPYVGGHHLGSNGTNVSSSHVGEGVFSSSHQVVSGEINNGGNGCGGSSSNTSDAQPRTYHHHQLSLQPSHVLSAPSYKTNNFSTSDGDKGNQVLPPLPQDLITCSSINKPFVRSRKLLTTSNSGTVTSGAAVARQAHANYQGDPTLPSNISANIPMAESVSIWIERLPPDVTHRELLSSIRNIGRVYATVISPPNSLHPTAAAKVVFFTLKAANKFLALYGREGSEGGGHVDATNMNMNMNININSVGNIAVGYAGADQPPHSLGRFFPLRGYPGNVVRNKILVRESDRPSFVTRVLLIKGPSHIITTARLRVGFSEKFVYEEECVVDHGVRGVGTGLDGKQVLERMVEFRFGSFRCQAEWGWRVVKEEWKYGCGADVRFGRDPCDEVDDGFGGVGGLGAGGAGGAGVTAAQHHRQKPQFTGAMWQTYSAWMECLTGECQCVASSP